MKTIPFIFACISTFFIACSSTTRDASASQADTSVTDTLQTNTAVAEELPLPDVPTTLREPAARAAYIIRHFWDAMDFADTLRSLDSGFMEQNFSNFISVVPYADEQARREAIDTLLSKAGSTPKAYKLLSAIAEDYLYNPNSPMYDEETYILFLENMINSPILDIARTTRLRHQLRYAKLNRPGMKAADFSYTTREGKRTRLHTTQTAGPLLLLFYDPDCDHCKELMTRLCASSCLEQLVANGRLSVLAIYADFDTKLWKSTNKELPKNWTVGINLGEIYDKELYSLRSLPVLYLLDADKTVILKDIAPDRLEDYLMQHFSASDGSR
ncbi:MAG: DUF5106 domain-containing protein [Prevotellaceae bacterium]|nr:DUF5106 domain-containing protein [Prevotellaceae bacterium]